MKLTIAGMFAITLAAGFFSTAIVLFYPPEKRLWQWAFGASVIGAILFEALLVISWLREKK